MNIPEITPKNAEKLGFLWIEDIKALENLPQVEREYYTSKIIEAEYRVGKPKNNKTDSIGLYIKLLPELPSDMLLTPNNASEKRYSWVEDVYYDPTGPSIVMQPIIDLVTKKGYKLGKPASSNDILLGLYKPL